MARVGSYVTSEEMLSVYLQRLVEAADRDEEVNTAIAGLVDSGLPTEAAKAVLEHARASGRVDVGAGGDVLVAHGSAEKLTSDRVQRHERLIERFVAGALEPPDLLDVADELGVSHLERQSLVASGALVRIGDLTFAGAVIDQACVQLGELQRASGPFTASQARVALGTTRRIVIPLLEHLRRIGRARFDGQQHHIVDY
jgi:selenocysteine-specific elongation factor